MFLTGVPFARLAKAALNTRFWPFKPNIVAAGRVCVGFYPGCQGSVANLDNLQVLDWDTVGGDFHEFF